jgi:hypothetical protein
MNYRWYLGGVGSAAAIGWIAARWHLSGLAPVGLVSLAVGAALGFVVAKLAAATGVDCPKRLFVGTVVFAIVLLFAEHTWLYHDFRRQWQEVRLANPQLEMFRPAEPWTPAEYFRRELAFGRAALWCLDAVLIATGALGVVFIKRGASASKSVVADDANNPLTSDL